MQQGNRFFRWLMFILLLASLLLSSVKWERSSARAAPARAASVDAGKVVISELRTIGPNGSQDEFIELYNRTNAPIDITSWEIWKSGGCGTATSNVAAMGAVTLLGGQRYLLGNTTGYSGAVALDQGYSTNIADDGGIALLDGGGDFVDQVGMCSTTEFKEYDISNPQYLSPLVGTTDQSYERANNGCTDTDDNYQDFAIRSPGSPQNSSATPVKCLVVTNVSSSTPNGTYSAGDVISVDVEFSSGVNVTGSPTLRLETGTTDRQAIYSPPDSSATTLSFIYDVGAGDVSVDLDYVGVNSLSLNGGSIIGAVGDADLTLPLPGAVNSLSGNKDIVIDNGQNPLLLSFERRSPPTRHTNANSLTFRVTFSEPVINVDANDFSLNGSTASVSDVLAVGPGKSAVYDITASGGNLSSFEGLVGLDLRTSQNIRDGVGNVLPNGEPAIDETYILDNTPPGVTVNQAVGQADPADSTPVNFTVIFSEKIDVSTFTPGDITQNGSISPALITWEIEDSGDQQEFTLKAVAVSQKTGTLVPSIAASRVEDLAGNSNTPSTSSDNIVNFNDDVRPSVTVNQAASQPDPATSLPITFNVVFSEPIISSIFTASDITQNGTATGVTWNITDTGDHMRFTLQATGTTSYGTLKPSIAANRVTDLVGNDNTPSTSTDNTVSYIVVPTATPTATPTPTNPLSIVISEIAWAGTRASSDDEWIELYNPTNKAVDITGWVLRTSDSSPNITLTGTIGSKDFFLLERSDDDTVFDVDADMIYDGSLSNIGEIMYLYDGHGYLVDSANKNGGFWPAGDFYTYASMERGDIISDDDLAWVTYDPDLDRPRRHAHDASGNVIQGTPGRGNLPFNVTATITPTRTNTPVRVPTRPGEDILILNEFLPRPGRDWNQDGVIDVNDEFIEVINVGKTDIDLSGYRLDDEALQEDADGVDQSSSPYNLPDITLKSGERYIFYASETGILLNDSGDTVRLIRRSGSKIVDAYTYGVVRYPDESWCRMPDGAIGAQFWNHPCFPTPNNLNALTGRFPEPPEYSIGPSACFLPDGAPGEFIQAECDFTNGRGVWNRLFWDGIWRPEIFLPDLFSKWSTFFK
jgi:hypothetical protein